MIDLKIGKPGISSGKYANDTSIIKLGVIGALTGEVVLNIARPTALEVVSKMMMMPVQEIDEMGQSAISELGNMIAGNAATVFANSNILIDITPPSYYLGADFIPDAEMFSVPFSSEAGDLSVDIHIQ